MRIPVAGRVPEASENPDAAPVGTLDVQLDAYYTTRVRGARCLAVVEIVVVEREGDRARSRNLGGMGGDPDARRGRRRTLGKRERRARARGIAEVSHVGSTPRGTTPRRRPSDARRMHFALEPCDAALAVAAAVPDDFPVTYGDVIPGVLRFDARGTLTSDVHAVTTTLVAPLLAPARRRRDAWSARLPPRRIRRRRRRRV